MVLTLSFYSPYGEVINLDHTSLNWITVWTWSYLILLPTGLRGNLVLFLLSFRERKFVPLGSSHPNGLVTPCRQRGFLKEVSKFMVSEVWASKFDTHIRRA